MKRFYGVIIAVALGAGFTAMAQSAPVSSCQICHTSADWFEESQIEFVQQAHGAHQDVGLSCHDCHGGNPDPSVADDMAAAMDTGFTPNPYRGAPERAEIPEFCGRCHSSLQFMRRFNPDARVDQVQEYLTSDHGRALQTGDEKVATCLDCHGSHEILKVDNPDSRVYPTNVADTCGGCHSDAGRMAGYLGPHGQPLPVDQVAKWKRSVHANALYNRGDLTAPTCNDCHGDHGATPPGVESVAFVCGQCHGRESELFRSSPKLAAFANHNDFLSDGTSCDSCHESFPPQIAQIRQFTECVTCHENHAVIRPTIALLGSLPPSPCSFCHEPSTETMEPEATMEHYGAELQRLLAEAEKLNLDDEQRFNWLVDQAMQLEPHTLRGPEGETRVMRAEFSRLFEKFRIGKTTYTYEDPVTGEEVEARVRQCTDCHRDPESTGRQTASRLLDSMKQLIGLTARSERILLAARRGGVETREAAASLDAAVDSQIELEVLVHTFSSEGEFEKKFGEGTAYAQEVLESGDSALEELRYRRQGLLIALAIIVVALVALALKIRSISG